MMLLWLCLVFVVNAQLMCDDEPFAKPATRIDLQAMSSATVVVDLNVVDAASRALAVLLKTENVAKDAKYTVELKIGDETFRSIPTQLQPTSALLAFLLNDKSFSTAPPTSFTLSAVTVAVDGDSSGVVVINSMSLCNFPAPSLHLVAVPDGLLLQAQDFASAVNASGAPITVSRNAFTVQANVFVVGGGGNVGIGVVNDRVGAGAEALLTEHTLRVSFVDPVVFYGIQLTAAAGTLTLTQLDSSQTTHTVVARVFNADNAVAIKALTIGNGAVGVQRISIGPYTPPMSTNAMPTSKPSPPVGAVVAFLRTTLGLAVVIGVAALLCVILVCLLLVCLVRRGRRQKPGVDWRGALALSVRSSLYTSNTHEDVSAVPMQPVETIGGAKIADHDDDDDEKASAAGGSDPTYQFIPRGLKGRDEFRVEEIESSGDDEHAAGNDQSYGFLPGDDPVIQH